MKAARVIFVDDEPSVCAVVSKTLERVGLSVRCFHSARDCLSHLDTEMCDLLITDVRMPEKDGVDLLCEVKRHQPWLPVLLVTGYADVPMAVRAMKAGAADFVEKPLDRDTFLRTVRNLLANRNGHRTLEECGLTRAEMRILYRILEGRNSREIGTELHRSPRTIEVHRGHVMRKLGTANMIELLRRADELGILQADTRDSKTVPAQEASL
ncbi:MAG TPA: response regulator [Sedimentisphaerales bacterium]|nr:response regulator [Sedimentisphaerales bacterium]